MRNLIILSLLLALAPGLTTGRPTWKTAYREIRPLIDSPSRDRGDLWVEFDGGRKYYPDVPTAFETVETEFRARLTEAFTDYRTVIIRFNHQTLSFDSTDRSIATRFEPRDRSRSEPLLRFESDALSKTVECPDREAAPLLIKLLRRVVEYRREAVFIVSPTERRTVIRLFETTPKLSDLIPRFELAVATDQPLIFETLGASSWWLVHDSDIRPADLEMNRWPARTGTRLIYQMIFRRNCDDSGVSLLDEHLDRVELRELLETVTELTPALLDHYAYTLAYFPRERLVGYRIDSLACE